MSEKTSERKLQKRGMTDENGKKTEDEKQRGGKTRANRRSQRGRKGGKKGKAKRRNEEEKSKEKKRVKKGGKEGRKQEETKKGLRNGNHRMTCDKKTQRKDGRIKN